MNEEVCVCVCVQLGLVDSSGDAIDRFGHSFIHPTDLLIKTGLDRSKLRNPPPLWRTPNAPPLQPKPQATPSLKTHLSSSWKRSPFLQHSRSTSSVASVATQGSARPSPRGRSMVAEPPALRPPATSLLSDDPREVVVGYGRSNAHVSRRRAATAAAAAARALAGRPVVIWLVEVEWMSVLKEARLRCSLQQQGGEQLSSELERECVGELLLLLNSSSR
jgi:hypothetical protein